MYEKLQILYAKGSVIVPDNADVILMKLYYALTALDQTAAAILTFDGILIAVTVFSAQGSEPGSHERQLARLVIGVALVSAGLSLWVAEISYPFLDKVVITPGPGLDFSKEFAALDHEVALRTNLYRIAWTLSLALVASLLLYIFSTSVKEFMRRLRQAALIPTARVTIPRDPGSPG
jgi:hypothetical protein